MQSWTKTDLAAMAKQVGMGKSYLTLCYIPTLQLHATVQAMLNRMRQMEDGSIAVGDVTEHTQADVATLSGHTCLSLILEAHIKYFDLPVDPNDVTAIYTYCWPSQTGQLKGEARSI